MTTDLQTLKFRHVIKVLLICRGNITLAAKLLGIGRATLNRYIVKKNIDMKLMRRKQ